MDCAEITDYLRGFHCSRNGVLEHEGKHYCKQHYPPNVKARREASATEWAERRRQDKAMNEIYVAERAVIEAAKAWSQASWPERKALRIGLILKINTLLFLEEKNAKSDEG